MKRGKERSRSVALFGVLTALAMLMGYIETLLPISIGVPGVKLGLANLVTVIALYRLGEQEAVLLSLVRVVLVGFTFGNMASLLYSMAGAACSLICMIAAEKSGWFGEAGVSIFGGISHNIGQLGAAAFVVKTTGVFWYFPVLLMAGTVTGTLIGMLAGEVLKRLPRSAGREPER